MLTDAMQKPLKILMVSAEVAPFTIVGGLAFVAGALPRALHKLGHDVRIVTPRHALFDLPAGLPPPTVRLRGLSVPYGQARRRVDVLETTLAADTPVPVYLIHNPPFFDRKTVYEQPDDAQRFILF